MQDTDTLLDFKSPSLYFRYMSEADVKALNIPIAHILSNSGQAVGPELENVQKAMDAMADGFSSYATHIEIIAVLCLLKLYEHQ